MMKKNWILKLAMLVMVLTLVTMPMVSSTYAKYVTTATGSDTARVAKWGVTIVTTGADAFAETYENGAAVVTVKTSTPGVDNMVAPGTSGTFAGITITGTPEVAVNVTTEATLDLTGWSVDIGSGPTFYCPIILTIGATTLDGLDYTTIAEFKDAVAAAAAMGSQDYAPGDELSAVGTYSWEWLYDVNDDVLDTALGNLASAPTITLTVKTTVTQID